MLSKKFKLILELLLLLSASTVAQTSGTYSAFDSSVIAGRRMPQQNEFWNNTYNFPAKPRNMWEIGASIGSIAIGGDVAAEIPGMGFEVHARKALGYVFSFRMQYLNGDAKGMNWKASRNYGKNHAWLANTNVGVPGNLPAGKGYTPLVNPVFYNYKTNIQDFGLQGIITLNNIRFHKQKTGVAIYIGGGLGFTWYDAKVNALDAGGNNYASLFQSQVGASGVYENRKDVLKALQDGMDDTYETAAENADLTRFKIGSHNLSPSFTALAGFAFKLSRRINLVLEDRHTFIKDDLLDGQQWQEAPSGDAVQTRNFDSYNYLSLGLNINLGVWGKSVEPLWWINPLDYAYSEINNPKDSDGDGVADHFDSEPNTQAGCPVDSHGVTKDTDGDGVPDCIDKQLITPTECQPVDTDGIGRCPPPPCCLELKNLNALAVGTKIECPSDYPSIWMNGNSLTNDVKAMCATVASKMKKRPTCSVTFIAYPGASKSQQSMADKNLGAIKNYVVATLGLSADRINIDKKIGGGDANTIDIRSN